jgi:hypothetical protein
VSFVACSYCSALYFKELSTELFDRASFAKEKTRLDRFAGELQQMPGALGYLIVYNDHLAHGERAKAYLVRKHKMEKDRIVIVEGGERTDITMELYIVPLGASPPTAYPPALHNNSLNRTRNQQSSYLLS